MKPYTIVKFFKVQASATRHNVCRICQRSFCHSLQRNSYDIKSLVLGSWAVSHKRSLPLCSSFRDWWNKAGNVRKMKLVVATMISTDIK